MKYIAAILFMLLMTASDGCHGHWIYWEHDGQRHTFVWGPVKP